MPRYLLLYSYFGSRFAGLQRQPSVITVQGALEHALRTALRIPSSVKILMHNSSRTDGGVHAIMNASTVTLPGINLNDGSIVDPETGKTHQPSTTYSSAVAAHKKAPSSSTKKVYSDTGRPKRPIFGTDKDPPYDTAYLQAAINHVLFDLAVDVRVTGVHVVHHGFCPRRHARLRTYLYRLAVLKPEVYDDESLPLLTRQHPGALAPLSEQNRSWAIGSRFDPLAFARGCRVFEGRTFNYGAFMGYNRVLDKQLGDGNPRSITTLRHVACCRIDLGRPLFDPTHEPASAHFDYYDVTVISRSFVFNQIRRMVGVLVTVAQSRITTADIQWLLDNPNVHNPLAKYPAIPIAPPHGLYLKHIDYDESDFTDPRPNLIPAYMIENEKERSAVVSDGGDDDCVVASQ